MPPRFKPKAGSRFAAARAAPGLTSHALGFHTYLKAECGMATNSVAAYARDLARFLAWVKDQPSRNVGPDAVTLEFLLDYQTNLSAAKYAPATIGRHLVTLKQFFRYLVLEGVTTENPAELLDSPKLWDRLPTVLSPQKVEAFLDAPRPPPGAGENERALVLRDRAALSLLYATGCRASEVIGLKTDDVRLGGGWARCLGKGARSGWSA